MGAMCLFCTILGAPQSVAWFGAGVLMLVRTQDAAAAAQATAEKAAADEAAAKSAAVCEWAHCVCSVQFLACFDTLLKRHVVVC